MRPTRLFRFGGAAWLEKSIVPAVITSEVGISPHLPLPAGEVLAERAGAGAVGDDRLEAVRFGCGLEECLAADGEADAADPVPVDVGALLEVRDGGVHVVVGIPAEGVGVAVALAFTAAVEQQHAVAVTDEHARRLLRASAAGRGDHGSAVLRGHVPASERQTVTGPEGHVLVGGAQAGPQARPRGRSA